METNPDVIIIGGGLAGLTASIHLSRKGLQVVLIEKSKYPRHKVCGEYVSNEILPYLHSIGVDILKMSPAQINILEFTTHNGRAIKTQLPLGGFGISRYTLDNFLYQIAISNGCIVINDTVTAISFVKNLFIVTTQNQTLKTKIVLGAYGKRSNIDQYLTRDFINNPTPWLAIKAHYSGTYPNDMVSLHNFDGGYCGISKVENSIINICYLANLKTFKKYKNIEEYQQKVLYQNKYIKSILENSTPLFEKPLTISQVSFDKKKAVEHHILMIGDTAGLIHPLCGNGMAMAIHSAKIASELVLDYHVGKIPSRQLLEKTYQDQWQRYFGKRLYMGRLLSQILQHKTSTALLFNIATTFPLILPWIIKQTHGKPISL